MKWPSDKAIAAGDEAARRPILTRLLDLAWVHRGACFNALFWALFAQGMMLGGFVYSGLAIDILRHAGSEENAPAPHWPFGLAPPGEWALAAQVGIAALAVLVLTILQSFIFYRSRIADERLVQHITVNLRVQLYDKLQKMSFSYFDRQDSGTLINRVTGDAASVRLFIQSVLVRMAITVLTLILFIGFMLHKHMLLTLAVISVLPAQIILMRRYAVRIRPRFHQMRESMDQLIQSLQESILGVRVIRGFGQEKQIVDRLDDRNEHARGRRMEIVDTNSTYMPAVPAVNFLQLAILLAYGGYLVKVGPENGGILLGTLWVFLGLIRQLSGHVDRIVQSASTIPEAMTGAERAFELLDSPIDISTPSSDAHAPDTVNGRIELQNVTFRFGRDDARPVLEDVSLTIEPGETIAIVGPAGTGKSTLLQLIPRFYEPESGRVLVDDVDVRDWDLVTLRRNIGYARQEPFLFSNSIANNIAFGSPDADEIDVRTSAEQAAALPFILDSEHGLDTIVGERGLTLSGGERQRLSLARTILIKPPILLLDDAMSSVDARTEVEIQNALDEIMRGRTTIVIAHRLSTLRRADRIVVLERGRITAIGTHDELMSLNEHYRRAATIQLESEHLERVEGEARA